MIAYGGIQAVNGIGLVVDQGELVTLIGVNGVCNTTTLTTITGTPPDCRDDGYIDSLGRSLNEWRSHALVNQCLAMLPKGSGIFTRISILACLKIGACTRSDNAATAPDISMWHDVFPRIRMASPLLPEIGEGKLAACGGSHPCQVGHCLADGTNSGENTNIALR
jgi:branched-chain amino acid transport system ATP-binding protein